MSVKRVLVPAVLLLLLAAAFLIIKPADEPAPASSPVEQGTANGKQKAEQIKATVVEITLVATDSLPIRLRGEHVDATVGLGLRQSGPITISSRIREAIAKREEGPLLYVDDRVQAAEDIGAIVVTHQVFSGQGRYGHYRKVLLAASLPPLHFSPAPPRLQLRPGDSLMRLFDVAFGPDDFTWKITGNDQLLIKAGGKEYQLAPGGELELPEQVVRLPVTVETFAPLPKGEIAADTVAGTETLDFGTVMFKGSIHIRYEGRRILQEASK